MLPDPTFDPIEICLTVSYSLNMDTTNSEVLTVETHETDSADDCPCCGPLIREIEELLECAE